MKEKLSRKENIAIGSLLFGLFFGAGNIIFPVLMGQKAGKLFPVTSIGFLLVAIGLPILGVISFALSKKENLQEYASIGGQAFGLFFTVALYMTIGPLFAIPRTATVAFEVGFGLAPAGGSNSIYLLIYSVLFFIGVLFFSLRPNRLMDVIGRILSPLFMALLAVIVVASLVSPMGNAAHYLPEASYAAAPLIKGSLDGYSTMDALASLAFGIIIIDNIRLLHVTDPKKIGKETAKSSLFTILFMSVIYIALAYIGATSNGIMEPQANGGLILAKTARYYFGTIGQFLLASTVTVACFKTAIGLIAAISQTFESLLQEKVSYRILAVIFTLASFIIANFGLNTIIAFSIPILMFLYPLAITLILLHLISSVLPLKPSAFSISLTLACIPAFFDGIKAAPEILSSTAIFQTLIQFAEKFLPLYDQGISWVIPVGAGILLSLLFFRKQ